MEEGKRKNVDGTVALDKKIPRFAYYGTGNQVQWRKWEKKKSKGEKGDQRGIV